ncbi:MAG: DinB family protein [Chloroflexi bacterium]|nr:DinB family protein [Chloroflexota bacterium]
MASSLLTRLFAVAGQFFFERPSKSLDYDAHMNALRDSGELLVAQMRNARDDQSNRAVIGHIIGIEHWAQARLRELLGAAPFREEYDAYKPPAHHTVSELAEIMMQTRQQTCAMVAHLATDRIALSQRVTHNQFGPLSAGGWLVYIRTHGILESKKLHK